MHPNWQNHWNNLQAAEADWQACWSHFLDLETATTPEEAATRVALACLCLASDHPYTKQQMLQLSHGGFVALELAESIPSYRDSSGRGQLYCDVLIAYARCGRSDLMRMQTALRGLTECEGSPQYEEICHLAYQVGHRFFDPTVMQYAKQAWVESASTRKHELGSPDEESLWEDLVNQIASSGDFFEAVKRAKHQDRGLSAEQRAITTLWALADPSMRYERRVPRLSTLKKACGHSADLMLQAIELLDPANDLAPNERLAALLGLVDRGAHCQSSDGELILLATAAAACERHGESALGQTIWRRYQQFGDAIGSADRFGLSALWDQYRVGRLEKNPKSLIIGSGLRIGMHVLASRVRSTFLVDHEKIKANKNKLELEIADILSDSLKSLSQPLDKITKVAHAAILNLPEPIQEVLRNAPVNKRIYDLNQLKQFVYEQTAVQLDQVLPHIDPQPLARGSASQLHRARIEMKKVVVKFVELDSEKQRRDDYERVRRLAWVVEGWFPHMDQNAIINLDEVRSSYQEDMLREGHMLQNSHNFWSTHEFIQVPQWIESASSARHLVMEYAPGVPLSVAVEEMTETERKQAAELVVEAVVGQLCLGLSKYFMRADDFHWHNGQLWLLDFGETLDEDVSDFQAYYESIANDDFTTFRGTLQRYGWLGTEQAYRDVFELYRDIVFAPFYSTACHITQETATSVFLAMVKRSPVRDVLQVPTASFVGSRLTWNLFPILAMLDVKADYRTAVQRAIARATVNSQESQVAS